MLGPAGSSTVRFAFAILVCAGLAPPEAEHEAVLRKATEAAMEYTRRLPDFICDQLTNRYESRTPQPHWKLRDRLEVEVRYSRGTEEYRNLRVNGKRAPEGLDDPGQGTWSKGEYGTMLRNTYSGRAKATFMPRSPGTYGFAVLQANSPWQLAVGNKSIYPAYTGTVWLDKKTGETLKIEMLAQGLPEGFPWDMAELRLEYGWVKIDGRKHLLPVRSENVCCVRDTMVCTRNVIHFLRYRKFEANSRLIVP